VTCVKSFFTDSCIQQYKPLLSLYKWVL